MNKRFHWFHEWLPWKVVAVPMGMFDTSKSPAVRLTTYVDHYQIRECAICHLREERKLKT